MHQLLPEDIFMGIANNPQDISMDLKLSFTQKIRKFTSKIRSNAC